MFNFGCVRKFCRKGLLIDLPLHLPIVSPSHAYRQIHAVYAPCAVGLFTQFKAVEAHVHVFHLERCADALHRIGNVAGFNRKRRFIAAHVHQTEHGIAPNGQPVCATSQAACTFFDAVAGCFCCHHINAATLIAANSSNATPTNNHFFLIHNKRLAVKQTI